MMRTYVRLNNDKSTSLSEALTFHTKYFKSSKFIIILICSHLNLILMHKI